MANLAGGGGGTGAVGITGQTQEPDVDVLINNKGYISPESPNVFGISYAQTNVMKASDALDLWISGSGIDTLGVATNWWPGMNIQDQTQFGYGFIPGYEDPTAGWNDAERVYEFTNKDTNQKVSQYVRYDPSQASRQFWGMSTSERARYTTMMVDAGLLDEEWKGIGDFSPANAAAFAEAQAHANYYGTNVDAALLKEAKLLSKLNAGRGGGGRGGGGGPKVQLEVPDYETLVTDAKNLIRKNLGRDPKDWEMTLVADEMQRQYGRWADATKRRMVGGNGTYEIPDPAKLSQEFVEDTYADEISRLEDVGDQAQTNQMLIGAATRGTQLMGGMTAGSSSAV